MFSSMWNIDRLTLQAKSFRFASAIAAVVLASLAVCAHGQHAYPDRPIRIIVPFPAGDGIDQTTPERHSPPPRGNAKPAAQENLDEDVPF